jgi:hypothetical protein
MAEPAKPLFDAINDAVSALTEVIRSLRASAQKTQQAASRKQVSVKTRVKRAGKEIKSGAKKVRKDVKTTARRAWETLHTDGGTSPQ